MLSRVCRLVTVFLLFGMTLDQVAQAATSDDMVVRTYSVLLAKSMQQVL